MKITKEITIEGADGMSYESLAQALREKADELERKEKVHEPECGDVYSDNDGYLRMVTDEDNTVTLRGSSCSESGVILRRRIIQIRNGEHTYLGKLWDVFELKSDHQKELAKLQAKYDDLVDKVVKAVRTVDLSGASIRTATDGLWQTGIERIKDNLLSTGEPRIIKALGGGK